MWFIKPKKSVWEEAAMSINKERIKRGLHPKLLTEMLIDLYNEKKQLENKGETSEGINTKRNGRKM